MFSWGWRICSGALPAAQLLRPVNLVGIILLLVGFLSIWVKRPWVTLISAICGILESALVGYMYYVTTNLIKGPGKMTITTELGPIEVSGLGGTLLFIGPPIILAIVSVVLLWTTADAIDKENENKIAA